MLRQLRVLRRGCDLDPFCCDEEWDNFCVGTAVIECASCGGSATGSCFSPHENTACNDDECCDLVCAADPFCCDTQWDNFCVATAIDCRNLGGVTRVRVTLAQSSLLRGSECCEIVCAQDPFCCKAMGHFCAGGRDLAPAAACCRDCFTVHPSLVHDASAATSSAVGTSVAQELDSNACSTDAT